MPRCDVRSFQVEMPLLFKLYNNIYFKEGHIHGIVSYHALATFTN
jgi:hypothetical protein